ncbi:MAG: amidohydrolase family protein [Nanoarchaeota archaeon]|nr:amidohydrolase family protein [Nanoarchaeota archaeon]
MILIKGGTTIDGSRAERNDVLVDGDRIVEIGKIDAPGAEVIDASGKYVTPGFIDVHNHGDILLTRAPDGVNLLTQGITSIVVGNCGVSALPISGNDSILMNEEKRKWDAPQDYFHELREKGLAVNVGFLLGQGSLRAMVAGQAPGALSHEQRERIKSIAREYIDRFGFLGISSGLIYAPGSYTSPEEMVDLLSVLGPNHVYKTHLRNEGDTVEEATKEALDTALASGVRLQLAHHKAAGRKNWGKTESTLRMVDTARKKGLDVGTEVYLYPGAHTSLSVVLPKELYAKEGLTREFLARVMGDPAAEAFSNQKGIQSWCGNTWDDVYITLSKNPEYSGMRLTDIARSFGRSPYQTAVQLLIDDPLIKATLDNMMGEEDIRRVLSHETSVVASDGFIYDSGKPELCHPRNYGNIARLFSSYVPSVLPLEDAVHKTTQLPAERYNLQARGRLLPGYFADIAVFSGLEDHATVARPTELSTGMSYVLLNGNIVVEGGRLAQKKEGVFLTQYSK